jgi:hypothetical protein
MPLTRSIFWSRGIVLSILVSLMSYMPAGIKAQSNDEAEIRVLMEKYFATYERKDLAGWTLLWSEKSPELAAARQIFQESFAANAMIEIKSPVVRKVTLTGDKATVWMVVEISVMDPKTGKRAEEFEKKNRTLHLVNESGVWRVWRDGLSEEELAAAISAARTDDEREVLLAADKELITVELRKALISRGIQFFTRGSYTQALAIFTMTLTLAQNLDDEIGAATSLRSSAK